MKTGPKDSGDCTCIYGSEYSPIHSIRGTIPIGCNEFSIKGAIPDPANFCVHLLSKELERRGMIIENNTLNAHSKRKCVYTSYSPPLKEIVYWTNQKSINLYAEHLLKKMGEIAHGIGVGSTYTGIDAVSSFWASKDIDLNGFNMADGSGLSRKNLITTHQLVNILMTIKQSDIFPTFLESIPIKANQIRAKSGSMSLIKGYAGYYGNIAFAILINHALNREAMQGTLDEFFCKIKTMNELTTLHPED